MLYDIHRLSKLYQIKILEYRVPTVFPINTLQAQRLLTVIKKEEPLKLEEASRRLWVNIFIYRSFIYFHDFFLI